MFIGIVFILYFKQLVIYREGVYGFLLFIGDFLVIKILREGKVWKFSFKFYKIYIIKNVK